MNVGVINYYCRENKIGIICENGNKNLTRHIIKESLYLKKGHVVLFESHELVYLEKNKTYSGKNYIGTLCKNICKIKENIEYVKKALEQDVLSKSIANNNFTYSDNYLLCFSAPELIDIVIRNEVAPYKDLLEKLDEYIESFDFNKVLEEYEVSLIKGGRCKPGDDDTAWAYIRSKLSKNITTKRINSISNQIFV